MRSVVAGVPVVGEPLLTGGVACRGRRGTALPLRPDARWQRRASKTLWEAGRARRDPGQRSSPGAARGTRVSPNAVACVAIVVTVRSRSCAAEASSPWWTAALPCGNRLETSRASLWAVAVRALGGPRRAFLRRKQAPQARGAPGHTRRDSPWPPEIGWWGHRPSQLQQCCTRGHRGLSVPIALRRLKAVFASLPSLGVRSTPARRASGVRASQRGSLVGVCRRALGGQGCPSLCSAQVSRGLVLC